MNYCNRNSPFFLNSIEVVSSGGNKRDTQNVGKKRDMKKEIMRKKERKSKSGIERGRERKSER